MADEPKEMARGAAHQAGIPLPEERVEPLAQAMASLRQGIEALANLDLAERGPAFAFLPAKE